MLVIGLIISRGGDWFETILGPADIVPRGGTAVLLSGRWIDFGNGRFVRSRVVTGYQVNWIVTRMAR